MLLGSLAIHGGVIGAGYALWQSIAPQNETATAEIDVRGAVGLRNPGLGSPGVSAAPLLFSPRARGSACRISVIASRRSDLSAVTEDR
jgi:hypothetical protein